MTQSAAVAVISIMLALIVKAALETALVPIFTDQQTWAGVAWLAWAQLLVYFVLTARFYVGAIRYVETEPSNLDLVIRTTNLIFAFLLFCVFYAIALSVTHPEHFYYLIIGLHLVDGVWFIIAFVFSFLKNVTDEQLQTGEIQTSAVRHTMKVFLFLDVLTLSLAVIWYYFVFPQSLTSKTQTAADWAFLASLFFISLLDFWALKEYYFRPVEWRAKYAKA